MDSEINRLQQDRDSIETEIMNHQNIVMTAKIAQKTTGKYMEAGEFGKHKLAISEKTLKLHQINRKLKELKTISYCINDSMTNLNKTEI